jgi:hypothetical protein
LACSCVVAVTFAAAGCGIFGGGSAQPADAGPTPGTGGAVDPGGTGGTIVSGSGGRGGSPVTGGDCQSSLDCRDRADGKVVCSVPTGECVGCLTPSDCGAGQDCEGASCVTHGQCINSLDCPTGQVCDRAIGRCVQCGLDADCGGMDLRCVSNKCRRRCVSDNECTPMGLLCNRALGVCTPCVLDGDCAANRWCSSGECALDVCVPGTSRCESGRVATCNQAGSGWIDSVACASGRSCFEQAGMATCNAWVCQPATVACAPTGERVVSCSADGLMATTMADCGAMSQVCVAGGCRPVICAAGVRFCENNQVRTCSAKGDSSTLYATCTTTQFCDAAAMTCRAQVCTPNQPACDMNVATTCNAAGSGFTGTRTDCTATGQLCSLGVCRSLVCTPNAYFCQGSEVRRCTADGLMSTLAQSCTPATQFCDPVMAACRAHLCSPNQPTCDMNVATTCNADGSGFAGLRTSCSATNQICYQGSCLDLACAPNALYCEAQTVRRCTADGLMSTLYQTCTATQYCDPVTATCRAQVCTPSQPACDGNVATTCNASGSGYTGTRTDCTASGLSCGAGVCTTCPGSFGAVDAVRIVEFYTNTPDFVQLRNTSPNCPADLAGLELVMKDTSTAGIDFPLPSRVLGPGQSVYVVELTAGTGTDINVGVNLDYVTTTSGWVVLCKPPCSLTSAPGVVDAVAINATTSTLPAPVTFTPRITTAPASTQSYQRIGMTGVAPSFLGADWTLGPVSR